MEDLARTTPAELVQQLPHKTITLHTNSEGTWKGHTAASKRTMAWP